MTRKPLKFCSLVEHSWILLPSCVLLQPLPILLLLRQVHAMYFVSISGIRHMPNTHLAFLNPLRNIWQRRIVFYHLKMDRQVKLWEGCTREGAECGSVDYLFAWLFDKGVEFHRCSNRNWIFMISDIYVIGIEKNSQEKRQRETRGQVTDAVQGWMVTETLSRCIHLVNSSR